MTYELWDQESGNVLGDFDVETEALSRALDFAQATNAPERFVLVALDESNEPVDSCEGYALIDRAERLLHRAAFA